MLLGIDSAGLVAQTFNLATTVVGPPAIVVPGVAAASVSGDGVLATSGPAARPVTVPACLTKNEDPEVYVQPFPNASDGKWLVSTGGGTEPHWSCDGKELFYFAGQTLMAVPVKLEPSFSSGQPVRLFDSTILPW